MRSPSRCSEQNQPTAPTNLKFSPSSCVPNVYQMCTSPDTFHHPLRPTFPAGLPTHLAPFSCTSNSASTDHCACLQINLLTYLQQVPLQRNTYVNGRWISLQQQLSSGFEKRPTFGLVLQADEHRKVLELLLSFDRSVAHQISQQRLYHINNGHTTIYIYTSTSYYCQLFLSTS